MSTDDAELKAIGVITATKRQEAFDTGEEGHHGEVGVGREDDVPFFPFTTLFKGEPVDPGVDPAAVGVEVLDVDTFIEGARAVSDFEDFEVVVHVGVEEAVGVQAIHGCVARFVTQPFIVDFIVLSRENAFEFTFACLEADGGASAIEGVGAVDGIKFPGACFEGVGF